MRVDGRRQRQGLPLDAAGPGVEPSEARAFGERLKTWRRLNALKQAALAETLGVSQTTVSFWECGRDVPNPEKAAQLAALMAKTGRDETLTERLFVERQSAVRALFDLDGVRLVAASRGFRTLWPLYAELIGQALGDRLVNEARRLAFEDDFRHAIAEGALGLASGISLRHTDLDVDQALVHRWHMCFRRSGARRLIDVAYEPCDARLTPGITDLVYLDV